MDPQYSEYSSKMASKYKQTESKVVTEVFDDKSSFDNNVRYLKNVVPEAKMLFQQLNSQVNWTIKMWNNKPLPRLCCHSVQQYEVGDLIVKWVEDFFRNTMNIECTVHDIFGNRYRDGNDYLPDHSDQYGDHHVVSLSFGATRLFRFKKGTVVEPKFNLTAGDLIIFSPKQNVDYKHGIPKQAQIKDERINLTMFCTFNKDPYNTLFKRSAIPKLQTKNASKSTIIPFQSSGRSLIEPVSLAQILEEVHISDEEFARQLQEKKWDH